MRSILIFHVLMLSATMALGQTAQPQKSPEKLAKLKSSYTSAVDRAVSPLKKTYLTELQKLKTDYTKSGDLEAALAVDAEIKSLEGGSPAANSVSTSAEPKKATTKNALEKQLVNTSWTMTRTSDGAAWGTMEFKDKGVLMFNKERKWTVMDKRKVSLEGYEAVFSDNLTQFKVVWGATGELTGVPKTNPPPQ
jgi:hypothetical protein